MSFESMLVIGRNVVETAASFRFSHRQQKDLTARAVCPPGSCFRRVNGCSVLAQGICEGEFSLSTDVTLRQQR
jgi:hypothetical protein